MRVSIYNRETRDGRRQYFIADKNSTGPFYLSMEASLLAAEAEAPKPSPKHDPTLEEQKTAFLHDKARRWTRTPLTIPHTSLGVGKIVEEESP